MTNPTPPRKTSFYFSRETINTAGARMLDGIYPRTTAAYFVPQDVHKSLSNVYLFKSKYTANELKLLSAGERKGAIAFFPACLVASMLKKPLCPETVAISVALMLAERLNLLPEQKGLVIGALSMFAACFEEGGEVGNE